MVRGKGSHKEDMPMCQCFILQQMSTKSGNAVGTISSTLMSKPALAQLNKEVLTVIFSILKLL